MKKAKYKRKAIPVRFGETPTPERRNKNLGVQAETVDRDATGKATIRRYKAISECILDIYYLRELITDAEYVAGMAFRKAHLRAVQNIKIDDHGSGNHGDFEIGLLNPLHSEKLLRAAYAVLEIGEKTVIDTVCGFDDWAGNKHRMTILRTGLDKLVTLWHIPELPN